MKNNIFILIILFLCVGCTNIKYNLSIEKSDVRESISVYDENHTEYNNASDYIGDMSAFEFFFQSLPYDSTGDNKGNYIATKEYKSVDEFVNDSFVFSKFINMNYISIYNSKVRVNIESDDVIYKTFHDMNDKKLSISLYIPYYVSSHNANSVNNNTYIWNFDNIENARLKIEFDMSKSYKYKKTLTTIIVVSIFCVIIVGIVIYFLSKSKKANEI